LGNGHDAQLTLALHRVDAGDLLADGAQPPVALQLAGRGLETEVEQLRLRLGQLVVELFLGGVPQVSGDQALSHHASPTSRLTNFGPCGKQSIGSMWLNIKLHQPLASRIWSSLAACPWPGAGPPGPRAATRVTRA